MNASTPTPTASPTNIPIWVPRPPLSQSVQVSSIPLSFSINILHRYAAAQPVLGETSFERGNVYAKHLGGSVTIAAGTVQCPGKHLPFHLGQHLGKGFAALELLVDVHEAQLVGLLQG